MSWFQVSVLIPDEASIIIIKIMIFIVVVVDAAAVMQLLPRRFFTNFFTRRHDMTSMLSAVRGMCLLLWPGTSGSGPAEFQAVAGAGTGTACKELSWTINAAVKRSVQ